MPTAPIPTLGLGLPIGVPDRRGRPIHLGDMLRFDPHEWGGPCEFVVVLAKGRVVHPGATEDLSRWCEVVRTFDGKEV